MKNKLYILALTLIISISYGSLAQAATVLYGNVLGNSAQNGYVLQSTGPNSTSNWVATSTLGISSSAGTGTISTSSPLTSGQPLYATGVNTIASVASSTFLTSIGGITLGSLSGTYPIIYNNGAISTAMSSSTLTASSPLTGSFAQVGSGGSLGCTTASSGVAGCLSNTAFDTFNGKQNTLGSLTGIIMGNAGSFYGTATSSAIQMSITGNAGTVTNGVYTTGAGSVYEVPLTFKYPLTRSVNAISFPATSTLYGTGTSGQVLMWSGSTPIWAATSTGLTAVGITTANGVSGTWSSPNLTISLGAITPTTVNGIYASVGFNKTITTNTALGGLYTLGQSNVNSSYDTGIGDDALYGNTSGNSNTGIGAETLYSNNTGNYNTAIGKSSLQSVTGSSNVALGYYAGAYETGSNAFYVNNIGQTNTAGDKAYSLLYGTFSGTAGSLTRQQLTINGILNLATTTAGTLKVTSGGLVYAGVASSGTVTGVLGTFPIISDGNATTPTLSWGGLATTTAFTNGNLFVSNGTNGMYAVSTSTMSIGGTAVATSDSTWTLHGSYPASCTNQFVRAIGDTNTCATVGAADVSLAALTATDSTLTFSGSYTGATARTIGLNLAQPNAWTGLATFANASSTQLSAGTNTFYIDSNGRIQGKDTTSGYTGVISPTRNLSLGTATSTAWTASTTAQLQVVVPFAGTIRTAKCHTDAGTLNVDIYHTTTHLALLNASTTVGTYTFPSNNTVTAGEVLYMVAGTPASSPTSLSCTLGITETP
jgi:hypothetical protein